jgi:5-methylcytosine-specific restriction endonuclease McrA
MKDLDHIHPVTGPDDPAFYDPANHQSLCHACHSAKTMSELKAGRV